MKKKLFILYLITIITFSCNEENNTTPEIEIPNASIMKVMPLGASRVAGRRPSHESFRFYLWEDLIENNLDIDYIGTFTDNASYPTVNGNEFTEREHQGRGGLTSGQILEALPNWIDEAGIPDIVLFSSPAGNDGL